MNQNTSKPYTLIGAEALTASVYKTGDELTGVDYRFNITRLNKRTGKVNHWFTPNDLCAMVKLTRVLAAELAVDGCMSATLRDQLIGIAAALDEAIDVLSNSANFHGVDNQ